MDTLQKGRYRKVFGVVESIAFLNALICSALHILGIADYIETLPVAHVILAGSVLIGFITMVCDLKRGYVSEKIYFFQYYIGNDRYYSRVEPGLFQSFRIRNLYRNRNDHTAVHKPAENDQKYPESGKPPSESRVK